jgi:hypothetical protein
VRNNRPKRNKAKMQIIEEDEEDYEYEEENWWILHNFRFIDKISIFGKQIKSNKG